MIGSFVIDVGGEHATTLQSDPAANVLRAVVKIDRMLTGNIEVFVETRTRSRVRRERGSYPIHRTERWDTQVQQDNTSYTTVVWALFPG